VDRRLAALVALCVVGLTAGPVLGAPGVNPAARTAVAGPLVVRWSLADPEAIVGLSWKGSPNLTNAWVHPACPEGGVSEFFGNSWTTDNDTAFLSPVGWGTVGTWAETGTGVDIASAAAGCYGTSGIPVTTSYELFGGNAASARIQVERRFEFGTTPFASDLRPYIPRLYPVDTYSRVLHPNATGTALVTQNALDCGYGCRVTDWNGTWFALHDPRAGLGMIVRHESSTYPVALWVDADSGSVTTATSVALLQPPGGFTGTVVDRQTLCLYDSSTWIPSLALPAGCAAAWKDGVTVAASKVGLASAPGAYTTATKLAPLGKTVTWQARLGSAAAGKVIGVWVAARNADGTWGRYVRRTARIADAAGVVTYSWRQTTPKWLSVRFELDTTLSTAAQARWR
jgi:hypothetical protein